MISTLKKIGNLNVCLVALFLGAHCLCARAGEVDFSVALDQTEIGSDESVSLKYSVKSEGKMIDIKNLGLKAPDFDVINEFTSSFVESFYENGQFGARNTQQVTRVLRPKHEGVLKIAGIEVEVDGKIYRAADLTVRVVPGGAATQPPSQYGGAGAGLRGAGKHTRNALYFIRAEIDQAQVVKGQQIIVSYYFYRRVQVFNISAANYPTFKGFLSEDLEMPLTGTSLDSQAVVLDGVRYQRSLIGRYAVYPLQVGKLVIPPMELKFNYYTGRQGDQDDGDLFNQFFRQMTPQSGGAKNDPITIDVEPLPVPQPAGFSGEVGDFTVLSGVDKTAAKTGEALTLTIKVEGRGNLASVEEPQVEWPAGLERYDAKGHAKTGRGGVGEKIFEILLIPRQTGKIEIPLVSFNFYNPKTRSYSRQSTQPITIDVTQGEAQPVTLHTPGGAQQKQIDSAVVAQSGEIESKSSRVTPALSRILLILSSVFVVFLAWQVGTNVKSPKLKKLKSAPVLDTKFWKKMVERAQAMAPDATPLSLYSEISARLQLVLTRLWGAEVKAIAREELRERALEKLSPELWARTEKLFDFCDQVQFSHSEALLDQARTELPKWIAEAEIIEESIGKIKIPVYN